MAFEHYDKCSLLLPMDGANNGTTFTDWSPVPKTASRFGDAKTSTAQSKYYGSSGYFDGNGDCLSVAHSADLTFGTGDFTISLWVYGSAASQVESFPRLAVKGGFGAAGAWNLVLIKSSGALVFDHYTPTVGRSLGTLIDNQWNHIAITRQAGVMRGYLGGVETFSASDSKDLNNTSALVVGAETTAGISDFTGYLQDFLIIKGAALWTANFTPPTRLVGQISGTVSDITGAPAARAVIAVPRSYPARVFSTVSAVGDGAYSLRVPATEVTRVAFAQEASVYNDLVARIIPE